MENSLARKNDALKPLATALASAQDLLRDYPPHNNALKSDPTESLPSLLEQCQAFSTAIGERPAEPVRTIHHFACTGGTLISKCLAALPNTALFSEIDPLSTIHVQNGIRRFAPTDLLVDLHCGWRKQSPDFIIETFLVTIEHLRAEFSESGQHMVIRDHPHSHFCTKTDYAARPTLRDILSPRIPVLSLVTLRHPLDSYLSLHTNGWNSFQPFTLEEYSRRYLCFLEAYADVPQVRYEDFVANPSATLAQICDCLSLPFNDAVLDLFAGSLLTGDSGRRGDTIGMRQRRPVSDQIRKETETSALYQTLCDRIGYDPVWDHTPLLPSN